MKRFLTLLPLALLLTVPHAQQSRSRVGFVNVQQLVSSMPGSAPYLTLRKNVDTDLGKREQSIQTLAAKATRSRSASDRAALQKAQQDYANIQKGYASRLATTFKPLSSKLDKAISGVARSSGFGVVFDQQVAARSKLVVYANTSATDLTPAVLKAIKK